MGMYTGDKVCSMNSPFKIFEYSFLKAGNDNKEFYEKIINNNFDNPGKISDYVFKNMLRKSSEKNVLIFNHPEFLKA